MKNSYIKEVDIVRSFKTRSSCGFNKTEIARVVKSMPNIHQDRFHDALMGSIGDLDDKGNFVIPRRDIEKAVICGMKNENTLWEELN